MKLMLTLAAFSVIALAGCGTTTAQAPTAALVTGDESTTLDFIEGHTPQLDEVFDAMEVSVDAMSTGDYELSASASAEAADLYSELVDEWNALPVCGGVVSAIESLFEDCLGDLGQLASGLLTVIKGGSQEEAIAAVEQFFADRDELDSEIAYLRSY